jgi:hypothetical protein
VAGNAGVTPPPPPLLVEATAAEPGGVLKRRRVSILVSICPWAGGTERDCRKEKGRKWSSPLTPVDAELRFILFSLSLTFL